jgi:integrase
LIPNIHSEGGYYSSIWFRVTKKTIEQKAGVSFKLKDFRPTFAQILVDIDPNLLPDVSAILGHSTISTTQEYYSQIKGGDARRRLEDAMTRKIYQNENVRTSPEPNFQDKQKKALMGSKEYLSGYY